MRRWSVIWSTFRDDYLVHGRAPMMRVRLTRKLANYLDGIDLSAVSQGQAVDLPRRDAQLLIAEGWALPLPRTHAPRPSPLHDIARPFGANALAEILKRLRHLREHMERRRVARHEHRRAEDRIRDELQDSRAKVVSAGKRAR